MLTFGQINSSAFFSSFSQGFTSRAQMENIAGLHGARSAGGAGSDALLLSRTEPSPLKNAGYGAADGGLVREQVYVRDIQDTAAGA